MKQRRPNAAKLINLKINKFISFLKKKKEEMELDWLEGFERQTKVLRFFPQSTSC